MRAVASLCLALALLVGGGGAAEARGPARHAAPKRVKAKRSPAKKKSGKKPSLAIAGRERPQEGRAGKKDAAPPPGAEQVATLGRGHRLFVAGDYAAARQELRKVADGRLRNRDYALYLLAQSEALSGAPTEALAHFRRLAGMRREGGDLTSRFAGLARARAADLAFELRQWSDARRWYRLTLKVAAAEIEPAVARHRLALIDLEEGRAEEARAGLREVWLRHPEHPLADAALEQLRRLDAKLAIDPRDRIARARRLTEQRLWPRALDELALLPGDLPRELRDEADYWEGTTRFRMRQGYEIAAGKLLAVAERLDGDRRTEALFHGARAWSRADQDDKAIAGYRDLVRRYPRSRQAAEASFLIGWLEYNRGAWAAALPALEDTLRRYGDSSFGDDARWYHGLSRWLTGDAAGALADFEIIARRSGALDGGKGRYWKGRALQRLGRVDEAKAVWTQLNAEFPLTYYALLARVRLAEAGVQAPPLPDDPGRARVPELGAVDEDLAREPAVARADELLAAGMTAEAGYELDRADGTLIARHGARALPLLFHRYARCESYFRQHRLAESHSGGALRADPHAVPAARRWWELAYPLAYRPFVEKHGPTGENPPYYLYTIMQKESAYNPHDVSYADAIGLLQMIPPTSRRVAERIGRPYTDDVLYDPEGNIQFGAWYIGRLLKKFKGQVALGAGSYNAGPKAMMRWLKRSGDRPLDEFVELCAYTQTREYMKKALDIYARYLYLYQKQPWLPDMRVDPRWLDDGIDY